MATDAPARIHELDFCDKVATWANVFFGNADSPFTGAGIEGFGTGELRRKRKDLRFYDRSTGHLAITGEVRLPGAKGGESPYDPTLMGDAEKKAENANVQYFFTWNVNVFVLFDRSKWNVPLVERRVREWRLDRHLRSSADVARTENLEYIRTKFLPELLLDLGRIYRGQAGDWPMAPDDIFIRSLDSHLSWPIDTTRAYLARQGASKRFDQRLQDWMIGQDWPVIRNSAEEWSAALDRAAQTLVHVLANRLIFYQALRARFADLPRLQLRGVKTAAEAYASLQRLFEKAMRLSGDYETLLYPDEEDWAGRLVL